MVTARFLTRLMVLLMSMFLLSACGGDDTTTSTPLISDGAVDNPTQLLNINSATTNSGQVGNKAAGLSYYYASVVAGRTYTITLYGLSADADLLVYNGHPFNFTTEPVSPWGCTSRNGSTTVEQCMVTAESDTMNIAVDGQYTLDGATYSISVNYPNTSPVACSGTGCFNFDTGFVGGETSFEGFVQSETGSLQWSIDCTPSDNLNNTGCNIHSTGLADSQTSCVSYTSTTETTYVSFNWMTDSTLYYDQLLFYIDNVLQLPVWSGPNPGIWQNVMFNTASGTHTYQWCHSNSNTNAGLPTSGNVWVDDIYIQ